MSQNEDSELTVAEKSRTYDVPAINVVTELLDELRRFGSDVSPTNTPGFSKHDLNTNAIENKIQGGRRYTAGEDTLDRDNPVESTIASLKDVFNRLGETYSALSQSGAFYTDEAPRQFFEEEHESYNAFGVYGDIVFSDRNPHIVYKPFLWYTEDGVVGFEVRIDAPSRHKVVQPVRITELFDEDGCPLPAFEELSDTLRSNATRLDRAEDIAGSTKLSFMQAAVLLFSSDGISDEDTASGLDTIKSTVTTHRERARERYDECLDDLVEIRETLSVLRELTS